MTSDVASNTSSNAASNKASNKASDAEWLEAVIGSVDRPGVAIDGVALPGFPPVRVAGQTVADGMSRRMLTHASVMHATIRDTAARHGVTLDGNTKVLDFGVGFGRIARFFLREVARENLYGVDVLENLVEACRETFGSDTFDVIEQEGVLPHADDTFDLVFANSVFSHLEERLNLAWFHEIVRTLKPGGLAALTIIDRPKFEHFVTTGGPYYEALGIDPDTAMPALDRGEMLWFDATRKGALTGYGYAVVPHAWVRENWTSAEVLEFDETTPQTIVWLRKR